MITVATVSFNRPKQTARFIKSLFDVAKFDGTLLVIDNGSTAINFNELQNLIKEYNYQIIKLNTNHGPSFARNVALNLCNTEFIAYFEDDSYFTGPFPSIASDITTFIYKDQDEIMKVGVAIENDLLTSINNSKVICPLWPGCGGIIKTELLRTIGGFDNRLTAFEDIDMSLRINATNNKTTWQWQYAMLVHDHQHDNHYAAVRYNVKSIKQSALLMEAKHGHKVWNDHLIEWINHKLNK